MKTKAKKQHSPATRLFIFMLFESVPLLLVLLLLLAFTMVGSEPLKLLFIESPLPDLLRSFFERPPPVSAACFFSSRCFSRSIASKMHFGVI